MGIAGKWRKISTAECDKRYPDEIEFFEPSRYLAKKGPAQNFIWWDAGTYQLVSESEVRITTATDALTTYRYSISGDFLKFVDSDGCEFEYERKT
ncbi:MAG TPA: hypothetical protein VKM94_14790 [Blastocatellia bacterium]|nr:hypothetical protein [Blastocatellia bacterium]